jgi:hypothetical protein
MAHDLNNSVTAVCLGYFLFAGIVVLLWLGTCLLDAVIDEGKARRERRV